MELTTAMAYIEDRFARYGISLQDGLTLIHPEVLANASPQELYDHMKQNQISHKLSIKSHPELKGDINNCFLENETPNNSRQENDTTDTEVKTAWEEQLTDFHDQDYNDNGIPDLIEAELELVHI